MNSLKPMVRCKCGEWYCFAMYSYKDLVCPCCGELGGVTCGKCGECVLAEAVRS